MSKKQRNNNQSPRELPDINKEYQESVVKAGLLQYELKAKEQELLRINQRISDLVAEGNLRSKLNSQKAPAAPEAEVSLPAGVQ